MDGSRAIAVLGAPPTVAGASLLDDLRVGWRPIVARDRRVIGVRIEVWPLRGSAPEPLSELLAKIQSGLTADGSVPPPRGLVVVCPSGFEPDVSLAHWRGPRNLLIEVGSGMLDAARGPMIAAAQRADVPLVLRLEGPCPAELRRRFRSVVAERAGADGLDTGSPVWVRGIQTRAEVDAALAGGAAATIGWPLDEPAVEPSAGLEPTRRAVLDIVRLIQSDADVVAIERAFRQEPSLAFMLLALVNSPALSTGAPITALGHAILVVGYKRLIRWLVLLLGVSSQCSRSSPLVHRSVQRGLFLEELAGRKASMRDDLFVVGAFSLLDRVTGQSQERLFASAALPRAVLEAVRGHQGPYGAYLALAEVIERGDADAIERAARLAGVPIGQVNAALLQSLAAADALTFAAGDADTAAKPC